MSHRHVGGLLLQCLERRQIHRKGIAANVSSELHEHTPTYILYVTPVLFLSRWFISPPLLLLILLIRGVSLPGAIEGVKFYLLPDPSRLTDPQVAAWMSTATPESPCGQMYSLLL